MRETAFERVDSHMIVVEHDKQIILVHRGVIQSLECQTAGHSAVTDDGNHVMIVCNIKT